jgi:hypothetical protein
MPFTPTPLNFVLTDLSSSVTLSQTGNLTSQVLSISGDAVAVFFVKTTDMQQVFQFETDAINVNDLSAQDMKFYVNMQTWPANLNPLNPANAMMDVPTYSSGAISSVSKLSGAAYDHNKALVKHDFIRYIAQRMFNTYQAVDLFNNQLEVIQNIETVCDGSGNGHAWHDISAALYNVDMTNGTNHGLLVDSNGNKYMTTATTTPDNLSRELFLQIVGNQPNRLTANPDGSSRVLGSADRQNMLFYDGDTINFNVTINAASGQETVSGLSGISPIPPRTYVIKLIMVSNSDGSHVNAQTDTIGNTISIDSVGKLPADVSTAATLSYA